MDGSRPHTGHIADCDFQNRESRARMERLLSELERRGYAVGQVLAAGAEPGVVAEIDGVPVGETEFNPRSPGEADKIILRRIEQHVAEGEEADRARRAAAEAAATWRRLNDKWSGFGVRVQAVPGSADGVVMIQVRNEAEAAAAVDGWRRERKS